MHAQNSHPELSAFLSNFAFSVDISDISFFFFSSGRGKGESEAPGRGDRLLIENPRRGRGRGAGRVSTANWGIWGGGALNFLFFFLLGRNVQQEAGF